MKVQVYWNSHKDMYSVRNKKTRRVIRHSKRVFLKNATPVISQSGLKRKIRTGVKNIYAVIEGDLISEFFFDDDEFLMIGFKGDHFGSVEGWERYQKRRKLVFADYIDLGIWSSDQDEGYLTTNGSPRVVAYGCKFEKIKNQG
jgi:hypothetical protein